MSEASRRRQNVTVSLPAETIHQARILAARRSTSISQLLADELARLVSSAQEYDVARSSALALLDQGLDLGATPLSREQIHAR